MKKFIVLVGLVISILILQSAQLPYILNSLVENQNLPNNDLLPPLSSSRYGWSTDLILQGNFRISDLPASAERIHRYHNLTTLKLPINQLKDLEQITGIKRIYPSIKSEMLLDISTSDHMNGSYYAGCDADYIQENLSDGAEVIVGLIDPYQLNWQHEDFANENGTRILSIWDQQATSGNAPEIFGYGAEYSQDDLNEGNGPVINSGQHHGTQCTGIIAGDGSASGGSKAGMLPQAQIIYVRQENGSADLINAISYIAYKASEIDPSKPVVISMSVGAMFSEPDGSDPVAQALTSFGSAGHCSAVAAGNWYNYDCFATGSAQFDDPVIDFSFTVTGTGGAGNDFVISRLYYNQGDDFSISLSSPDDTQYGYVSPGEDNIFNTPFGMLYIFHETTTLDNPYIEIVVSDESGNMSAGDVWTISLDVPSPELDDQGGCWWGWIAGVGFGADFQNYYQGAYSLNTYACGEETVCVGAHDKNSGNLYGSSSSGAPNGIVKPEITAPTNAITPNASNSSGYSSLCCTSGATPHVAGAMGLILSRNQDLQPYEVINRLTEQAFSDGQTGDLPDPRWGWGKLNARESYLFYSRGDVDNNGYVDAFDSSIILMYGAGINFFENSDPLPWDEWRFLWADVDGNGIIEAYDASLILQYVVELITEFPTYD